jgi:hypothetical protein
MRSRRPARRVNARAGRASTSATLAREEGGALNGGRLCLPPSHPLVEAALRELLRLPVAALDQLQEVERELESGPDLEQLPLLPSVLCVVGQERKPLAAELPTRLSLVERHGLPPMKAPHPASAAILRFLGLIYRKRARHERPEGHPRGVHSGPGDEGRGAGAGTANCRTRGTVRGRICSVGTKLA